nr:uncharacterized protein LOC115139088 [Oncorhynchus nerka]
MAATLELAQWAQFFNKPDLRNAYNLIERCEFHIQVSFLGQIISTADIQMDPVKVEAVANWPHPTSLKQVQRFLGFGHFYRHFNFGAVPVHLMVLTLKSQTRFCWIPEVDSALTELKGSFTSGPILNHPDPTRPFVVEMDTGAGAVLSQRNEEDMKLQPCAFLSKQFLTAERNYDVGNLELLAVK